eukprot:5712044-Alexandrium_andersonii.AAC.1
MSASLVGSEMCIRDRSSSASSHPTRPRPPSGCASPPPPPWTRCGPRSVSYTHLTLPTICSV